MGDNGGKGMTGGFPSRRMRRLRMHPTLRAMLQEVRLCREDLISPLFVRTGSGVRKPIEA